MADKYEGEFDPNSPESYKQGLYEFMDERLREELGRVGEVMLGRLHEEARRSLIGKKVCVVYLTVHTDAMVFSPPPSLYTHTHTHTHTHANRDIQGATSVTK